MYIVFRTEYVELIGALIKVAQLDLEVLLLCRKQWLLESSWPVNWASCKYDCILGNGS